MCIVLPQRRLKNTSGEAIRELSMQLADKLDTVRQMYRAAALRDVANLVTPIQDSSP
jgi:hypothetical protein